MVEEGGTDAPKRKHQLSRGNELGRRQGLCVWAESNRSETVEDLGLRQKQREGTCKKEKKLAGQEEPELEKRQNGTLDVGRRICVSISITNGLANMWFL